MKFDWTERVALMVVTTLAALFLFAGVANTIRLINNTVVILRWCGEILCY